MSSGALKGIEVILIAGVVFWFAYSQLTALKQSKPSDATKPPADDATTNSSSEDQASPRDGA